MGLHLLLGLWIIHWRLGLIEVVNPGVAQWAALRCCLCRWRTCTVLAAVCCERLQAFDDGIMNMTHSQHAALLCPA